MSDERPVEFPGSLPVVSREALVRLLGNVHNMMPGDFARFYLAGIREGVPLKAFIKAFSEFTPEPEEFEFGATYSAAILKDLEQEGYYFPPVNEQTARTYLAEFQAAMKEFSRITESESLVTKQEQLRVMPALQGSVEFNFPDLSKYQQENPYLMAWFAHLPRYAQLGAATVYDLKRRQFQADQLAKGPFGQ